MKYEEECPECRYPVLPSQARCPNCQVWLSDPDHDYDLQSEQEMEDEYEH